MKDKAKIFWHTMSKFKYLLTLVLFVAITGFLDTNSYIKRRQLCAANDSLRAQIAYYEACCKRDSTRLKQLQNNPNKLVRVAREDYLMKSADEDIYIIIEENQNQSR